MARAEVLSLHPAEQNAWATQQMILCAATLSSGRIVAVGERGVILLSDDGVAFRQARSVPAAATLNTVSFVDDKHGWAAGHWGVILKTDDGGETWTIERQDLTSDRPIFSVLFLNDRDGIAAGLWSLLLVTRDGGITWEERSLPASAAKERSDLNLTSVFADRKGRIFITAESGKILRSEDQGRSWTMMSTGYSGTFWSGLALDNDTLLVGGLRGTIYRSTDAGQRWQAARSNTKSSVTALVCKRDGTILASTLDGALLQSNDDGRIFEASQSEDRTALTALAVRGDRVVVFSKHGLVVR
jgi:photosystem II stability/assembly factor-like uncharacterized protein